MEPWSTREPMNLSALSPSERQVLELARSASTAVEIARDLSLSEATVRTHLSHIYEKLGVRGRVELLARLQAEGAPLPTAPSQGSSSVDLPLPDMKRAVVAPRGHVITSAIGAVVGGVTGMVVMPATAHTPLVILLVPLLAGAPVAIALARRPGGLDFFAAVAGVCGAILVALSLAAPLSCPAGEFSPECTGPAVSPIMLPGLGLVIVGLLLSGWAARRRRESRGFGPS